MSVASQLPLGEREPDRPFSAVLRAVKDAGEDFEWYPTSDRMIAAVARRIPERTGSIMDIGAGDGRVLLKLAQKCEYPPTLYAIEKSVVLIQQQPENVIPVGTDLFEQNLTCLPVDYIFCNPPYSQFEEWVTMIVESGYARKAFFVIPQRWRESDAIAAALKRRGATTHVIGNDDFFDAVRSARAVVDIVEVSYPCTEYGYRDDVPQDPFDLWFAENIHTFDAEAPDDYDAQRKREQTELARVRAFTTIADMVGGYNEEYERMQENYRAIFRLDYALLRELGVSKDAVREGIKKKMAGLKSKYWQLLFERLDMITNRLSTKTKARFLETLTKRNVLAFTANNAYAVVLWAIKNANAYFGEQVTQLFRDLSTFDGVMNYKSNQRTWEKSGWRYRADEHSHYALDYRIVVTGFRGINPNPDGFGSYDYPGGLAKHGHELIADIIAVLYNLGFQSVGASSFNRAWTSGSREEWYLNGDGRVLFEAKAFKNGNVHFRFMPDAIKALNVEAGRLLGWLHGHKDVETELGYTAAEARRFYFSTKLITPSNVRLLEGATI